MRKLLFLLAIFLFQMDEGRNQGFTLFLSFDVEIGEFSRRFLDPAA